MQTWSLPLSVKLDIYWCDQLLIEIENILNGY